ncbi:MAG: hypothetical protein IH610_06710 [Deltaproteobacteria bacterium]|nr:hypothetical protein [Deltaproteobacteria bacterium]
MKTKHFVMWMAVLSFVAMSSLALADDKGQGGMSGMKMEDHGGMKMDDHGGMKMDDHGKTKSGGHDMMNMGDKVFSGKVGPWHGEAHLIDMKAQMEKAKASGMKMEGMMNTHHIALSLNDPKAKSPVTEGKGTVTVTGPDKKSATYDIMVMQGHFGADVNLAAPGKYKFKTQVESGGKKGSATFSCTVK